MSKVALQLAELVERYWRHHRTRFLLPLGAALLLLGYLTGSGSAPLRYGHVAFAAVTALLLYYAWIWDNRVPKVAKNSIGILLALTCDDDAHDKQVRSDFVASLRQLLHSDRATTRFHFIDLAKHHAVTCEDVDSANQMLAWAKGHCILYGSVRKRQLGDKPGHLLRLEGSVRHTNSAPEVRQVISADFRAVLPRKLAITIDVDAFAFEATSEWTELAARYVIGIAALASGDVWYAEQLLLSVEARLKAARSSAVTLQNIAQRLPARLVNLYSQWVIALYNAYYLSRRKEFLVAADAVSKKLLARSPDNYEGRLQRAICEFVLRRDIKAAKAAVIGCRKIRNVAWRYSLAFLYAYEGNMIRARQEYHEAFQARLDDAEITVPVQSEEFIQLILAEEPEKVQLHFASAEINQFAKGDFDAARRDYATFLARVQPSDFPEEVESARSRLPDLPEHATSPLLEDMDEDRSEYF